jgi:hypothetical protein
MEAVNQEAAALEAATMQVNRFSESLARATAEAESNLNAATQREEEARRALFTPGGVDSDSTVEASIRADQNLEDQRRLQREVEQATALARNRIEREANDPNNPLAGTFARLRQIEEELASGDPNANRGVLVRERAQLNARVDRAVSDDQGVRAARDDSTLIEEKQKSEIRGFELALTPAQRAGRELARGLNDIQSAVDRPEFALDPATGAQAQRRIIDEAMRQTAPAIFNMADEVMNAVVQGPSRAALQVNDITTAQGAAELNRLLRGDDSAKNQNLVELQKQSTALTELVTIARENGAPPGVFDN